MRPQNLSKHIKNRWTSRFSPVLLGLMGAAGLVMLMQAPLRAAAATEAGGLEFKVLEANIGSGSRPQEAAKPQVQFEVLEVATGSGMGLKGQAEIVPAVTPPPAAAPLEEPAEATPVITAQNQMAAAATKAMDAEAAPEQNHTAMFAALDTWHRQTLASYNYDIKSLQDPFLPIKEVRGTPEMAEGEEDDANKPPILKMALNQLKLVAITTLSDRPGGALASFEDGAGASYILRQGDLIGRDNGRITLIEPSQVTVEEHPRSSKEPRVSVLQLNILSNTTGLTRESDPQPMQIEIQTE